jgi:hypothetical protein
MKRLFAGMIGLMALTGVSHAESQAPVAVVEDVQGKVSGAEFMDYVVPGQVIKLGDGAKIVLGYMKSCWQETISGIGTVIVGTEQSSVHLAGFKADKVPCDPNQSAKVGKETGESAATVVRSLTDKPTASGPQPLMLHGTEPMVVTAERGKMVVERVDVKGERYVVDVTPDSLTRGKFFDFAKTKISLQPGGAYSLTLNSKYAVFVVDPKAAPGASPVIGRLVMLK